MSYQSLTAIVEEIKTELAKLENQELSVSDIDAIQRNAQELYERLTVLKYSAMEKLVKAPVESDAEPVAEPESKPEEPSASNETAEPAVEESGNPDEVAERAPIKFHMKPLVEEIPENQTNLLDEIKERSAEVIIPEGHQKDGQPARPGSNSKSEGLSLNDKLAGKFEPSSLAEKLKKQPIVDLQAAIGINQKFLFMNDLFEGERNAYHESIDQLNSFDSYLDADNYIKNNLVGKYNWDLESSSAVRFMELVERRYLS